MRIGLLKETMPGERRVALVPESVERLCGQGHEVFVEVGAGEGSFYSDALYEKAGAKVLPLESVCEEAEVLVKIRPPDERQMAAFREGQTLIALLWILLRPELARALMEKGMTVLSMDQLPRTSAAQVMDVLSSQATVAGYRAVLVAAERLPRFLPMLVAPAGTIRPARVLVLGAGVAGLQAIATARRLGAIVEAFDVRRAVKEQVESLGARFVEVEGAEDLETAGGYAREASEEYQRRQRAKIHERLKETDICITTAQIPGKRAPLLITEEMVKDMPKGSVIVDLAAETGGNCALTKPGETVEVEGVTIIGDLHMPSGVAYHASQMYSRNMEKLFQHAFGEEGLRLDDELVRALAVIVKGEVRAEALKERVGGVESGAERAAE